MKQKKNNHKSKYWKDLWFIVVLSALIFFINAPTGIIILSVYLYNLWKDETEIASKEAEEREKIDELIYKHIDELHYMEPEERYRILKDEIQYSHNQKNIIKRYYYRFPEMMDFILDELHLDKDWKFRQNSTSVPEGRHAVPLQTA